VAEDKQTNSDFYYKLTELVSNNDDYKQYFMRPKPQYFKDEKPNLFIHKLRRKALIGMVHPDNSSSKSLIKGSKVDSRKKHKSSNPRLNVMRLDRNMQQSVNRLSHAKALATISS
jgi:hypothetical protein